jgi:hypothetical protein
MQSVSNEKSKKSTRRGVQVVPKEIEKLAEFLEVQTTKQTIKDIAMATAFDNMQKNKFDMKVVSKLLFY